MHTETLPTSSAPAGRSSAEVLQAQHQALRESAVATVLETMPIMVVVLNSHRQIVFANGKAVEASGRDMGALLGMRPGEAFRCMHAFDSARGCGAGPSCSGCGAAQAILKGLDGIADTQEYNLLNGEKGAFAALDLEVNISPIQVGDWDLLMFSIQDISHEKRRRNLERLFFHDVLNTAGGLRGLMDLLRQEVPATQKPDADFIYDALARLVDEIVAQKDLLRAESNELPLTPATLGSLELVRGAALLAQGLAAEADVVLEVDPGSDEVAFVSDTTLVRRILGNMVKNAVEAAQPGARVGMGCRAEDGGVAFWVRNPGAMREEVRTRVFTRSFSTKGPGRGLGTYGMKLLAERYLGGRVWFDTNPELGTIFHVWLPAGHDPRRDN